MLQLDARSQTILDLKHQLDNIKDDLLPNLDNSLLVSKLSGTYPAASVRWGGESTGWNYFNFIRYFHYFLSVRFIWVYWFCVYLCPGTRIVSIDILVSHTSIALCPILFHITESTHKELDSGRQIILTIPPFCNLSRSKSASSEKVSLF
jgi:hypothetical protein